MGKLESFEQFLAVGTVEVSSVSIITSLTLAALFSFVVSRMYIKYGESLSNRKAFASNFVLLTVTITLIIFIVKSSLALSLGLVGALSIVRFRAAIKEPEELVFLFFCIALGLGLGAGQIKVTVISFIFVICLIYLRHKNSKKTDHHDMHLIISGKDVSLNNITKIVKENSLHAKLRRFDQNNNNVLEAAYSLELKSFNQLEKLRKEVSKLSKTITVTYLDKVEI